MLKIDSKMQWTESLIRQAHDEIMIIAKEEMGIDPEVDLYPNQIEIVSAEQMIDAYVSIGLPVHYHHWSFGKEFMRNHNAYTNGAQGLAYELIINSNPCIQILMEENSMMEQTMVMAHCVGHNFVYKNNAYFKEWTDATSIIDYMVFARDFIRDCELRYGYQEVERVLDACHALSSHGVDRYKRRHTPKTTAESAAAQILKADAAQQAELDLILQKTSNNVEKNYSEFELEREENLLYFIMKNAPNLENWKREIIRIVYKINQYFYPQTMCQTVHEGMASFCHFYIMTRLEEKGIITPDAFLAFLKSHSGVVYQPNFNDKWYSGFNPYALGFNIFRDIKRMCEEPTEEDYQWNPMVAGGNWQEQVKYAAANFRDDGFILQMLSPKVIRDMHLFSLTHKQNKNYYEVSEIHDDEGYKKIRATLAASKQRINFCPEIYVDRVDFAGNRELELKYVPFQGRELNKKDAQLVLGHMDYLWGFPVSIKT